MLLLKSGAAAMLSRTGNCILFFQLNIPAGTTGVKTSISVLLIEPLRKICTLSIKQEARLCVSTEGADLSPILFSIRCWL